MTKVVFIRIISLNSTSHRCHFSRFYQYLAEKIKKEKNYMDCSWNMKGKSRAVDFSLGFVFFLLCTWLCRE
jgi:hypothetical protein